MFVCRFDCGSGQGVVRSAETVLLNQWNRLSVHRHRWDASIRLNSGRRVAGRSKVKAANTPRIFFRGLTNHFKQRRKKDT